MKAHYANTRTHAAAITTTTHLRMDPAHTKVEVRNQARTSSDDCVRHRGKSALHLLQ